MTPELIVKLLPLALSLFGHHHNPQAVPHSQVQAAAAASGLSTATQSAIVQQAAQPGGALTAALLLQELFGQFTPATPTA